MKKELSFIQRWQWEIATVGFPPSPPPYKNKHKERLYRIFDLIMFPIGLTISIIYWLIDKIICGLKKKNDNQQ